MRLLAYGIQSSSRIGTGSPRQTIATRAGRAITKTTQASRNNAAASADGSRGRRHTMKSPESRVTSCARRKRSSVAPVLVSQ